MKRYRYFCRNCFEKEGKEITEIIMKIKGLKPSQYLHKRCEICKQEMELQEELIGMGDVSLGWRKL
jgi:hypothetical protein